MRAEGIQAAPMADGQAQAAPAGVQAKPGDERDATVEAKGHARPPLFLKANASTAGANNARIEEDNTGSFERGSDCRESAGTGIRRSALDVLDGAR
jgi:hypothetical protein